ncbi:Qat anti-phage system TatD family nuclease QatD [Brevundimonas sp. A19_0]|uniref:Qat anti-phage system TatD family nuclease QatD n=1 Tax=Brevundimonas sp. A19_0 TaxID=2821087 RepID=UPI001ADB458D|nr:Qat anti-phage system TatD family nuclease QatD [Brevundimonas sp. A19_0]MBO9501204.1 TatD family hydrolase [Brevundimonas sp. A19_0]
MIDFHCHIDLYADPAAVLAEAEAKGVYVLAVTTTPKAWAGNQKLVRNLRRVRVGLGLHPELVAERHTEIPLWEHFLPEARYVGEIGLDGSPQHRGSFDIQKRILKRMLRGCADAGGRIMSFHSRRAATPVLDLIEEFPAAGTPVLHWFSGTERELARAVKLGCWFSVGPSMLNSAKGKQLAQAMPAERVLTETDAPFAQVNGRPLMPWDVSLTYVTLAEVWRMTEEAVPAQLHANLRSLLGSVPVV